MRAANVQIGSSDMNKNNLPACVRYHPERNSTLFAVTDDTGEVVAIHEVFLDAQSREIGRATTGDARLGFVRFAGKGTAQVYYGQPEDAMKQWMATGVEIWVDVSDVEDTVSISCS